LIKTFTASLLEKTLNNYLLLDPETLKRLSQLNGKTIQLELQDLGLNLFFLPQKQGLAVSVEQQCADTVIKSTLVNLICANFANDHATRARHLSIEGDMELGQTLYNILQTMEIDWEEQLSRFTGDIFAHQTGNLIRGVKVWFNAAKTSLQQTCGEYLQEEVHYTPPPEEVRDFLGEVDYLRDDVERLAARIDRLK
jgi:ubiquinone biosynthesis protein UbiJ